MLPLLVPIVSAAEMVRVEKHAIMSAGDSDLALRFMEAAGTEVGRRALLFLRTNLNSLLNPKTVLLCGRGNNAGDAYVCGRYLLQQGFSVSAIEAEPEAVLTRLCALNKQKYIEAGGQFADLEALSDASLLIDGLLGTGYKGEELGEPYKRLITAANQSLCPILAIDVPSGLDATNGIDQGMAIQAHSTLCLGLYKEGLFLRNSWNFVSKLELLDFGLDRESIAAARYNWIAIDEKWALASLPEMLPARHKFQAGTVLVAAGSLGMEGSGTLVANAALRSGAGLVRWLTSESLHAKAFHCYPEVIKIVYPDQVSLSQFRAILEQQNSNASVIGPGLSSDATGLAHFVAMLELLKGKLVLDAQALNFCAEQKLLPPKGAILTPHRKEMARLLQRKEAVSSTLKDLLLCCEYAQNHEVVVVLKGAPTFIFSPDGEVALCFRGDPGMATAGSGDVLAGVMGSMLAQGLEPVKAARVGVCLHGLAGEFAVKEKGRYGLVASDIITALPRILG